MKRIIILGCLLLICSAGPAAEKSDVEKVRYLRLTSKGTRTECTFNLRRGDKGWSIQSVTEAGKSQLLLLAQYDAKDKLIAAEATLTTDAQKKKAQVEVTNGKARVKQEGKEVQEFDVPAGVIVTSAPDWTDTFLLCRRYDRGKAGKQEFPGLWIHPVEKALRLTFTIERTGSDTIEHEGKKLKLDRFVIRLRNNSGYAAWADKKGRMIKLEPMQASAPYALLLAGYEKSAAKLQAPPR